jgi:ABC-type phosphonate transport system ATPase subunit
LLNPVLEDLPGFAISARLNFGLNKLLAENVNHYTERRQKLLEITEQVTDIIDYLTHNYEEALRLRLYFTRNRVTLLRIGNFILRSDGAEGILSTWC